MAELWVAEPLLRGGAPRPGKCRKRTLKKLKKLPPPGEAAVGREAVLRAWLVSNCRACMACLPK